MRYCLYTTNTCMMFPGDMESKASSMNGDQPLSPTPSSSTSVTIPTNTPTLMYDQELQFSRSVAKHVYEAAATLRAAFLCGFQPYTDVASFAHDETVSQLHYWSSFISFVNDPANNQAFTRMDIVEVTRALVQCAEDTVLAGNDIHMIVAHLQIPQSEKRRIIKTFVTANSMLGDQPGVEVSNLVQSSLDGESTVYVIFGGQGNGDGYFAELAELYEVYQPLVGDLVRSASELFRHLTDKMDVNDCFSEGMELMAWIDKDNDTPIPSRPYLLSSAISFPLITLLQLLHFKISFHYSGCSFKDIQRFVAGVTGHSQGIIAAAAIAAVDSPASFHELSLQAMTVSFSMGVRIHQYYGPHVLPQLITEACLAEGKPTPTPMLSVRGLSIETLATTIQDLNKSLPRTKVQMEVGLRNNDSNYVITGDPMSLRGLCTHFDHKKKALDIVYQFLPAAAPYHNSYLSVAASRAIEDCQEIILRGCDLKMPVFSTVDGSDLRNNEGANLVPDLIRMVCCQVVNWPAALNMPGATHILDFGPGGAQGVGVLANSMKASQGVRVIHATVLNGLNKELGYKPDLFDRSQKGSERVSKPQPWVNSFQPTLTRFAENKLVVSTRFTRLFLQPPIMVAAMTPTTTSWDFVAAVMKAGFHAELACGGFHDRDSLSAAITAITNQVEPGTGITCNVIYSSPTSLRWQIDELEKLVAAGYQIDGLSIGAGVPSVEVVQGYVERLQLQHIALKPGSTEAIERTLKIAKALQPLPVVLQWTGGRGGGHHSNQDFHAPLISMYGKIRAQDNVVLVVGSGFGGPSDTLPYITGKWASDMGLPPMPVDGILLGSRVMVAKEAHTSTEAKHLIVATEGVPDDEWSGTCSRPTGGILSVISEMRQPIHKIATRAVRLWHELDQTIFYLGPKERVAEITRRRDEIIRRLNHDYHRVWFGCSGPTRDPVELDEMTYSEVLHRFVELAYVTAEHRWVHLSWKKLFSELLTRTMSRLHRTSDSRSETLVDDLDDPYSTLATLTDASAQLITYEDSIYFLQLFRQGGQKPVPFIPVLDADFETWFKKDSLWQSEDIAAVPNHEAQRVCILHGPVAAQYSTKVDEPVSEILGNIHSAWVTAILQIHYQGQSELVPVFDNSPFHGSQVASSKTNTELSTPPLNHGLWTLEQWIVHIVQSRDKNLNWAKSLLASPRVLDGRRLVPNPFITTLSGLRSMDIHVAETTKTGFGAGFTFFKIPLEETHQDLLDLTLQSNNEISIQISHYPTLQSAPITLTHHLSCQLSKLAMNKSLSDRSAMIRDFYHRIWLGTSYESSHKSIYENFECEPYTVTADAIRKYNDCTRLPTSMSPTSWATSEVPLDFAVVIAWKALIKPLFSRELEADILKLLHVSNEITLHSDHSPPMVHDVLHTKSQVTEVILHPSGKMVQVEAHVFRGKSCILDLKTRFLLVGNDTHRDHLFRRSILPPSEILLEDEISAMQLVQSSWFQPLSDTSDLVGKLVVFQLEDLMQFNENGQIRCHQITGCAMLDGSIVGNCYLETPDDAYLSLIGNILSQQTGSSSQPAIFETPLVLFEEQEISFTAPTREQTIAYSAASGDSNPIHVSPVFASLAGLSSPIVHGMHISAEVLQIVYTWLCASSMSRLKKSHVLFAGKVCAGDKLAVSMKHTAMHRGLRVVEVQIHKNMAEELVFVGTYEIEQPPTALVFTGQGSQKKGMGMDLRDKSAAARRIWDTADDHFQHEYGFRITDIVCHDPPSLTVHFGGVHGRRVRSNYMALTYERVASDGQIIEEKLFPTINENTTKYVFTSESGLLSSTQFTQPALGLMELAIIADFEARQLIPSNVTFAGHSLGEYSALMAVGNIMPLEVFISTVFYRGLVMQSTVTYDHHGRSKYAMCAVDPTRVSTDFGGQKLGWLVTQIASEGQWLLEVVNHNVIDSQYVCAGEAIALHCLGVVLDRIHYASKSFFDDGSFNLTDCIRESVKEIRKDRSKVVLSRSKASIPLKGLDVPFHSSHLRSGVDPFRRRLQRSIKLDNSSSKNLIGRYIPNLTGKPFEVTRQYFNEVLRLTGSIPIQQALESWDRVASTI